MTLMWRGADAAWLIIRQTNLSCGLQMPFKKLYLAYGLLKGFKHVRCGAAVNSMGTLINGADAGVAIITSAVAAANATLIRAHQVVGQIDTMANEWAQSPVGSIIGQPPRESPLKQLTLLS